MAGDASEESEVSNWFVRYAVASNPNTPVEVLSKLADDMDWHVRGVVAKNPNTPTEVLAKLSEDDNEEIRAKAIEILNSQS